MRKREKSTLLTLYNMLELIVLFTVQRKGVHTQVLLNLS